MQKSIYDFETLEEAIIFFIDKDVEPSEVEIGGGFDGPRIPTEDDGPTFYWDDVA